LQILEAGQRYLFVVVGYVVMPDHIHLLSSEPEQGKPSTVVQVLKQGFARQVLHKRRCPDEQAVGGLSSVLFAKGGQPHVWQRRFYDFNV
jgi:REP element-mobilizing transposase RayT